MAKIHVLEATEQGMYRVVIHTPTPVGNNSVGELWKDAALKGGDLGSTVLVIGTGPSDITQVENDSIVAGNTMELSTSFLAESGGSTNPEVIAALAQMVDEFISENTLRLQRKYKYYGHSQG